MRLAPPSPFYEFLTVLDAAADVHDQADDKADQEQQEEYLADGGIGLGRDSEAEDRGDDRDHQKHESPVEHVCNFLPTCAPTTDAR